VKEIPKKELPAVSGGKAGAPSPFNDPGAPSIPEYPQNPVVPTDPEGDGPGCG
jgi:hypothetical protein